MDSEQIRRARKPRGHRLPAPLQPRSLQRASGHSNLCRRVHILSDGFAAYSSRRSWVRAQVGYGLDARHAELFPERSNPSEVSTQPADLSHALFVPRKFRAAAEPRRGRARKRFADRQNARRRVAEICQPALAFRLHVRAAREEAALYGLRVWPSQRVVARSQSRLERTGIPVASWAHELGRTTQPRLSQRISATLVR